LGDEAADWIVSEMADNKYKRPGAKKGKPKKYWISSPEEGQHNPRGMSSYLESDFYVKTPRDAHEELKVDE
jgi:hypothetical protein